MIHPSWQPLFDQWEFHLDAVYGNFPTYPAKENVLRAFSLPVHEIRIVLLGQDPYHGEGQANGLSFSVSKETKIPPSLQNIFKELKQTFPERGYEFLHGDLSAWQDREKICLLNASLTVLQSCPGSHMAFWKPFTDEVIQFIDKENPHCVFLLLGNFAKAKQDLITKKDRIVMEVHPSPLARGFVGSGVFERVEKILGEPIDWSNA